MQSSSQIITINKPTSSFFTGRMPPCRPTNSVKALKWKISHSTDLLTPSSPGVFQPFLLLVTLGEACHASYRLSDASTPDQYQNNHEKNCEELTSATGCDASLADASRLCLAARSSKHIIAVEQCPMFSREIHLGTHSPRRHRNAGHFQPETLSNRPPHHITTGVRPGTAVVVLSSGVESRAMQ